MTLSALNSMDCGIVSPIRCAVLRLITSSNLVGLSTGRSAGLAPFRILSTKYATHCYRHEFLRQSKIDLSSYPSCFTGLSFDHLIRSRQNIGRNRELQGVSSVEVDGQIVFCRFIHRQASGIGTL